LKRHNVKWPMSRVRTASKSVDAWITVLIFDPIAEPIVYLLANFTRVTPNSVTVVSILLCAGAAVLFWNGPGVPWVVGGVLYALGFLGDCVDGKLARLTNQRSKLGLWLDHAVYLAVVYLCITALVVRGHTARADGLLAWLGGGVVFLHFSMVLYEWLVKPLLQSKMPGVTLDPEANPFLCHGLRRMRLTLVPSSVDAILVVVIGSAFTGKVLECVAVGLALLVINSGKYVIERLILFTRRGQ
jgi:phosphatidylglycerophosphate synthase